MFKNVLPCVTGDLRDYISPQSSRSHCVRAIAYCITVGSILKKLENVCSLLFIPCFRILFGLTKALYSTIVKAVKRDNCKRGHSVWELISCIGRKDCVRAYMCTRVSVCPCVCAHTELSALWTCHSVCFHYTVPFAHNRKVCKLCSSQCWQCVNLIRLCVWMAPCVTGLCLTVYLFKSLIPALSQLLKLGMWRVTKRWALVHGQLQIMDF